MGRLIEQIRIVTETAIKLISTTMEIGIKKRPKMNIGNSFLGLVKIKLFVAAIAKLPNSREVREDSARDRPDLQKVSRFDSSKLPKPKPRTPVRSMTQNRGATTSRSFSHHGDSVVHHRSEPDYLTQALILDTIMSDPEPSRHSSSYDSGSSWSGDSGSSGGCD